MTLDLSSAIVGDVVIEAFPANASNRFRMIFSSRVSDGHRNQLERVIESQGIRWCGPQHPNTWSIPPTMDSLQAIEKICLWLESEGLEVCRKICECGSFKDIQSFVLA